MHNNDDDIDSDDDDDDYEDDDDDNDVGDDDDDDDDEDERDLVVDLERRGSPCHLSQANRLPASVFSRLEMMQRGKEDVEI